MSQHGQNTWKSPLKKRGGTQWLSESRGLTHHSAKALLTYKLISFESLSLKKPQPNQIKQKPHRIKKPKLTGLEKPSPKQVSKEKLKTNPGQKGELGFEPTRRLHIELAQDYCHSRAGDSSLCTIPTSVQMDSNPFCYTNVPKSAPLSQVPLQVQQHGATSPARQPDSSQTQKAAVKFSIAF